MMTKNASAARTRAENPYLRKRGRNTVEAHGDPRPSPEAKAKAAPPPRSSRPSLQKDAAKRSSSSSSSSSAAAATAGEQGSQRRGGLTAFPSAASAAAKTKTAAGATAPKTQTAAPPETRRAPKTLKSRLRAEIQEIKRRKKFVAIEDERRRRDERKRLERERIERTREREKEGRRLLREEERRRREEEKAEAKRLLDLRREEERKIRHDRLLEELELRRRMEARTQVRVALMDLVQRVERRIEVEARTGVPCAVKEALDGVVDTVAAREGAAVSAIAVTAVASSSTSSPPLSTVVASMTLPASVIVSPLPHRPSPVPSLMEGSNYGYGYGYAPHRQPHTSYPHRRSHERPKTAAVIAPSLLAGVRPSTSAFATAPPQQGAWPFPYPSAPPPPSVAQRSMPPPAPSILHPNPILDLDSPFRKTHSVLEREIVIAKDAPADSFGVVFRYESRSVLVDPPSLPVTSGSSLPAAGGPPPVARLTPPPPGPGEKPAGGSEAAAGGTAAGPTTASFVPFGPSRDGDTNAETPRPHPHPPPLPQQPRKKQRRRRRRRVIFGVMAVVDAGGQNARIRRKRGRTGGGEGNCTGSKAPPPQSLPPPLLQPGDIVLSINGRAVGSLVFGHACRLFAAAPVTIATTIPTPTATATATATASATPLPPASPPPFGGEIRCVLRVARRVPAEARKEGAKLLPTDAPPSAVAGVKVKGEHGSSACTQSSTTMTATTTAVPSTTSADEATAAPAGPEPSVLTIARSLAKRQRPAAPAVAPPPLPPPVVVALPFVTDGSGRVLSGGFTPSERRAFVAGLWKARFHLSTGAANRPASRGEVLLALLREDGRRKGVLKNRRTDDAEILESNYSHRGAGVDGEAGRRAEAYWIERWRVESERSGRGNDFGGSDASPLGHLSDAQRHEMRSRARPARGGCRCGNVGHEYVHDDLCALYRDVRVFAAGSAGTKASKKKKAGASAAAALAKKISRESAVKSACVERFRQLQAEGEALRTEAEYVYDMERTQASEMNRAVFAPAFLCAAVLSAVAVADERVLGDNDGGCGSSSTHDGDDSDDSDDDDVPLVSLDASKGASSKKRAVPLSPPRAAAHSQRKKRRAGAVSSASTTAEGFTNENMPSAYALAEILKVISETFGHVFREPADVDYAWQQRHRTVLRRPVSKEVMFAGNPRKAGKLSFENVRFAFDDDRLGRLKRSWLMRRRRRRRSARRSSKARGSKAEEGSDDDEELADEASVDDAFAVYHLASDTSTGLLHEIQALQGLNVLKVSPDGRISLAPHWYDNVPRILLVEMNDGWGRKADPDNFHCVHETVRSALEGRDDEDDCDDDEEYYLRKKVFEENYEAFVNERNGVGDFGI